MFWKIILGIPNFHLDFQKFSLQKGSFSLCRKNLLAPVLEATLTFAKHLERTTIIVQREEGTSTDVDTVILCLIQIMLDKQYRTIEGLSRLVEKEWVIFGCVLFSYTKSCSSSILDSCNNTRKGKVPPYTLFFLFANCLVNLIDNQPSLFEYNQTLLANFLVCATTSFRT